VPENNDRGRRLTNGFSQKWENPGPHYVSGLPITTLPDSQVTSRDSRDESEDRRSRVGSRGAAIIALAAMMSNHAWLILIFMLFGAFFIIARLTVKTFRYKYGGLKVPRVVGGVIYVGLGVMSVWVAIMIALKP
jgi:hypothetical protein